MEDDKAWMNASLGCNFVASGNYSHGPDNCNTTASSGHQDPLRQNALSITFLSTLLGLMTICGVVGNVS